MEKRGEHQFAATGSLAYFLVYFVYFVVEAPTLHLALNHFREN